MMMEGELASPDREMRQVLSHSGDRIARLAEWVAHGNADLRDAASLVMELQDEADWLYRLVTELLDAPSVELALLLGPAVLEDAPLTGSLRQANLHVANARDLLRSARAHFRRICADIGGLNTIGMERALEAMQSVHTLRWRHPLAVAWGTHLGRCLVELASGAESLAISLELAVRANVGARVNNITRTATTSDLLVSATASAECLDALRESMAEFRALSGILVQAVSGIDEEAIDRFREASAARLSRA